MSPFILKPSPEAQDALKGTWTEVRLYLKPKTNKKYVRKCIADAWAGIIRKARSEGLARLVDVLLENEAEGLEAVWTNSLKGTSHNLHSRALPVINLLLDRLIETESPTQLVTLNMVFTALVHHCSSSTITPVVETVLSKVAPSPTEPSSSTSTANASISIMSVLSTILLVRKGKRYPESQLKPTMIKLQSLLPRLEELKGSSEEQDIEWRKHLVLCIMGSLQAGKLAQWLSPGVALIEGVWNRLVSCDLCTELEAS
jgi:U3 small nucleolar RNA-associated protein 20